MGRKRKERHVVAPSEVCGAVCGTGRSPNATPVEDAREAYRGRGVTEDIRPRVRPYTAVDRDAMARRSDRHGPSRASLGTNV